MASSWEKFGQFKTNAPAAGRDAPDFTARLLDGGELTLSTLTGRVVVLEFGAIT